MKKTKGSTDTPRTISLETSNATAQMLEEGNRKIREKLSEKDDELVFGCDEVTNVELWALSEILKDYPKVSRIVLCRNSIDDMAIEKFSHALESNQSVTHLDLSENLISASGINALSMALIKNKSVLKHLELENNEFEERAVDYICDLLVWNQTVEHINLSVNNVGPFVENLSNALKLTKGLKRLELENNNIGEKQLQILVEAFIPDKEGKCSQIEWLDLSYNIMLGYKPFALLLAQNTFLRVLELNFIDQNNYKNEFSKSLAKGLSSNNTLEKLCLNSNKFKDLDCVFLSSSLANNRALKVLDLEDNEISTQGIEHLIQSLRNNFTLIQLKIEQNLIADDTRGKRLRVELEYMLLRNSGVQEKNAQAVQNIDTSLPAPLIENTASKKRGYLLNRRFNKKVNTTAVEESKVKPVDGSPALVNATRLKRRSASNDLTAPPQKSEKTSGKRKFANKKKALLANTLAKKEIDLSSKRKPATAAADDDDDSGDTVVFLTPPVVELPAKMVSGISHNSSEEKVDTGNKVPKPIPGKLRAFALKKKDKTNLNKNTSPKNDYNDNFDDDFQSAIFDAAGHTNDNLGSDYESVVFLDEQSSDFTSVIFENSVKDAEDRVFFNPVSMPSTTSHFQSLVLPKGLDLADDESLAQSTQPDNNGISAGRIVKNEIAYIELLKSSFNNSETANKTNLGVIDLTKAEVNKIALMLSEFENLLDRDENNGKNYMPQRRDGKRKFALKKGILGKLPKNIVKGAPKVTFAAIAKDAIARNEINLKLTKSVSLVSLLKYLRRKVDSGVGTEWDGLLPSFLFDDLTAAPNGQTKSLSPSIDILERYTESLMFVKVVLWNVLKALSVCDPSVDPYGRQFLEEFSKLIYEKHDKSNSSISQLETGRRILNGALLELIDVLVLLKPMYCIANCLLLSVKQANPMPSINTIDLIYDKAQKKAGEKLLKRVETVRKVGPAKVYLKKAKIQMRKAVTTDKEKTLSKEQKTLKKNQLEKVLTTVEKQKQKVQSGTKKKVEKETKKRQVEVDSNTQKYREHCPERLLNIINDLHLESNSVSVILQVQQLLQFLVSFSDGSSSVRHYNNRVSQMSSKFNSWLTEIVKEFQGLNGDVVGTIDHEILPEIKQLLSPVKLDKNVEEGEKHEENFFPTLLNNLFNLKAVTPGMMEMLREKSSTRFSQLPKEQTALISQLTKLSKESCKSDKIRELFIATDQAYCFSKNLVVITAAESVPLPELNAAAVDTPVK